MATISYINDKKVTVPVSLKAVADLLNTTPNSDGVTTAKYDVGSVCTSGKINKWSKHKPVRDSRVITVLDNDDFFRQTTNANTIIWGMNVSQILPDSTIKDAWSMYTNDEDDNKNWSYLKPINTYPYRLGDFIGYYHLAKQFCQSVDFKYDGANFQVDEIRISTETQYTDKIKFFVNGITSSNGGISFSDLNYLTSLGQLVLCANVYDNGGDLIGEYINKSIRIGEATSISTLYTTNDNFIDYDDENDRHKMVEVELSINNTNTYNTFHIVLTLDFVKYDSNSHKWVSERKIAIPYSNDNYWGKSIRITRIQRSIQVYKVWNKSNDRSDAAFTSPNNAITAGFDYFRNPLIWFNVSQTSQPIRFVPQSGGLEGYLLRTKYFDNSKGTYHVSTGELDTQSGSGKSNPFYIDVPSGSTSETKSVFFQFSDMWGINSANDVQSGHVYSADLYLIHRTSSGTIDSEVRVGHVELKMQK